MNRPVPENLQHSLRFAQSSAWQTRVCRRGPRSNLPVYLERKTGRRSAGLRRARPAVTAAAVPGCLTAAVVLFEGHVRKPSPQNPFQTEQCLP